MKSSIILIAFIFCSSLLLAQSSNIKYAETRATKFTKEITDYITNLSNEQTQKLWEINKTVSLQFDSVRNLKLEQNDNKKAYRTIFVERDAAIKTIFNDKQYDMFVMMQAEKRDEHFKQKQAKEDSLKNNPLPIKDTLLHAK